MKTITIDFKEYEEELLDAYKNGKVEVSEEVNKALLALHNKTLDDLMMQYRKFESIQAEHTLMSYQKGRKK